jgi:hypothetical protein
MRKPVAKNSINASLVTLALYLCAPAVPALSAAALSDCGYYQATPSALHASLNSFVSDISELITQREDLQAAIAEGVDITEEIYAAGLLGRVDDCIHDDAGRNVEVVGGFVTVGELDAWEGEVGFTVIVRGLRFQQCKKLAQIPRNLDLSFWVRGEPPGDVPRNMGDCLNLPALLRFGMTLPQPNTAYILKKVQAGEGPRDPGNPQACRLFQQIVDEDGGVCSYYKELLSMLRNCYSEFESNYCQAALKCQSAARAELDRAGDKVGLEALDFDQRVRLYEEVVWGHPDKAIRSGYLLYLTYPDGFIDPEFSSFLDRESRVIGRALKDELGLPTVYQYRTYERAVKEAFLQEVADIVWAELEVSRFEIGFDYLPDLNPSGSGTYDPHDSSLTLHMANMYLKSIGSETQRDQHINTLLHEAFHHYQNQLILRQSRCKKEAADFPYRQTHVFAINQFANFQPVKDKEKKKIYPQWKQAYLGNPIEQTARQFAQAVFKAWQG